MISPMEDEMICYAPQEPVKITVPFDDLDFKILRKSGYVDENNKPTKLGIEREGLCIEMFEGRETEEHFQKRMRQYRKRFEIFHEWFSKRWGQGKYCSADRKGFPKDIPFPRQEIDACIFEDD